MRVTLLDLQKFRSFEGLTLDTDAPRVLIAGVNGSGKTSVRESLRWTLTGRCGVTDGRGAGTDHLVPHGADSVSSGVVLYGLGKVQRSRRQGVTSFGVEGMTGDATAQQAGLYLKVGTTPEYLDAVLETEHFLRLHHAEAKALVLGLLNVQIPVHGKSLTLDQVEQAYATAFAERKAAKVRLKGIVVPAKPTGDLPALEAIEAQLTRLRGELQTVVGTEGQLSGRRTALEGQLSNLERLRKPVPEVPADIEDQIAALTRAIQDRQARQTPEPVPASDDVTGRVIWLQKQIETLDGHQPKKGCVLDPKVRCESAKIMFTNRKKELQAELDALPFPTAPQEARQDGPRDLQVALDGLQATKSRREAVVAHNGLLESQAAPLRAELAQMGPVAAPSDEGSAVAALKTRIGKGEILLRHARDYWQGLEAHTKASALAAAAEAEVERLEAECELLGPKGARVEALGSAIGAFEERINAVTMPFGWTVRFSVDPWAVFVNDRLVETYSESEQFRIGIAIQLAVAEVSGLSFAVVDRLDMLDAANRKAVGTMLFASSVEQIFILSTREPSQPLVPAEGMKAYRFHLQNGRTAIQESV